MVPWILPEDIFPGSISSDQTPLPTPFSKSNVSSDNHRFPASTRQNMISECLNQDPFIQSATPRWTEHRQKLMSCFPPYESTTTDTFPDEVQYALRRIKQLKHPESNCPVHYGSASPMVDYSEVTNATIPQNGASLIDVIEDMTDLLKGLPNTAHPLHQSNVVPNSNKAAIIAAFVANYTSHNAIQGTDAWNLMKAEMETAAMLAKLIPGWSEKKASGVFTSGGTGCYLSGIKYALASLYKDGKQRSIGIRGQPKIICSQQGHYAQTLSADWLGIGMENCIEVKAKRGTNEMDVSDLIEKLQMCKRKGDPVVAIVCTMGTTDAFAIDDAKAIRSYLDAHPDINDPTKFNQPMIYCDAVIGWSFLMFSGYNFDTNPLDFSNSVKKKLEASFKKIEAIEYADAVGIDFHKTGWVQYSTSIFMMRDFKHYRSVMSRPNAAYLLYNVAYNPGAYTMEVSRSTAPALAAWSTLKYLGKTGFQTLIGSMMEMSQFFRYLIAEDNQMVCCNEKDNGFVTLFRIYPSSTVIIDEDTQNPMNAKQIYAKELAVGDHSPAKWKALFHKHNEFQAEISGRMWAWLHSDVAPDDGWTPPYTSISKGFRPTESNDRSHFGKSSEYMIFALKSYPMNINITTDQMTKLYNHFKKCAMRAEEEILNPLPQKVCEPYKF